MSAKQAEGAYCANPECPNKGTHWMTTEGYGMPKVNPVRCPKTSTLW